MTKVFFDTMYIQCRKILGEHGWRRLCNAIPDTLQPGQFPAYLRQNALSIPDLLPDLAEAEQQIGRLNTIALPPKHAASAFEVNPTLHLFHAAYRIDQLFHTRDADKRLPWREDCWIMIWKNTEGRIRIQAADDRDLLALKMTADDLPLKELSAGSVLTQGQLITVRWQAVSKDLILAPAPAIKRQPGETACHPAADMADQEARYFTLQWHVTNACDLHCKHCYDRSSRHHQSPDQGLDLLQQMASFCLERHTEGHVCFSGGNPFLYPHFETLYRSAADHGFSTSILGNPVNREALQHIVEIQPPEYYQVSLEGLQTHTDAIRGEGHFHRVFQFLGTLRELNVTSAVMLTLTRDNLPQVLALAEALRGHADRFTFNRLSPVGEGADIQLPAPEDYHRFLKDYVDASRGNAMMGYKDNLINRLLRARGEPLGGGCTGFGCGAAFSFLAVLPDGEVHACRKFPSLIGNLNAGTLHSIYDGEAAQQYRNGSTACRTCTIRHLCGGCLAVTSGLGKDPFHDRDPFCMAME